MQKRFGSPALWLVILVLVCPATVLAQNAVCVPNSDGSDVTCTIHQPVVDQRSQNGFRYDNVVFKPNDLVTITAGGCVQTGGHGATWKRYVNPSGPDSDHLYFGTIGIPGIGAPGYLQRIQRVQQFRIPAGVAPPNNVLVLGYRDDGYGDNGYWGHDDGTEDQCKEGPGRDGGPAWVIVLIQHGLGNPSPGKPFDMVTENIDANGAPLNPEWQFEKDNPGKHPDATASCADFPLIGRDNTNPTCTTQPVSVDSAEGFNLDLCAWKGTSGKFHGHADWWPATVTGTLVWAGHDSTYSGGTNFGDDDYNFFFFPSNVTLLTHDSAQGARREDWFLETEFDSDETVDHFDSKWWNAFHDAVDQGGAAAGDNSAPLAPASQLVNNKQAIITGLVGIDAEHGPYTELHPVYTMAIHMNPNTDNDEWAFFARNWGDEGFCSHEQHYWDTQSLSLFIPEPVPSTDFSIIQQDVDASAAGDIQASKVDGGILLTFNLGAPDNHPYFDGSISIHWVPAPSGSRGIRLTDVHLFNVGPQGEQAAMQAQITNAVNSRKESDAVVLPALSPQKKAALAAQLKKAPVAKHPVHLQITRGTHTEHPQKLNAPLAHPKIRVVPDPAKAARDQHNAQVICAAFDNNIPGVPAACH